MTTLCVKRFAIAVGVAFALLRLGCDLIRTILPRETAVRFFNTLTHGVDWTPISRWEIPVWESGLGLVEVFILGCVAGAVVATVYNLGAKKTNSEEVQSERFLSASSR